MRFSPIFPTCYFPLSLKWIAEQAVAGCVRVSVVCCVACSEPSFVGAQLVHVSFPV